MQSNVEQEIAELQQRMAAKIAAREKERMEKEAEDEQKRQEEEHDRLVSIRRQVLNHRLGDADHLATCTRCARAILTLDHSGACRTDGKFTLWFLNKK